MTAEGTSSCRGGNTADATFERLEALAADLRCTYSADRAAMMAEVADQVAEARSETDAAQHAMRELRTLVQSLRSEMDAAQRAARDPQPHIENSTSKSAMEEVDRTLRSAQEDLAMVRSGLLYDRIRREEARRRAADEDAALERRVSGIEIATEQVRREARRMRATTAGALRRALDALHSERRDAPQRYATAEREAALAETLRALQGRHSALEAQVEQTAVAVDARRAAELRRDAAAADSLRSTVHAIRSQPQSRYPPHPVSVPSPPQPSALDSQKWHVPLESRVGGPPYLHPRDGITSRSHVIPTQHEELRQRIARFYSVHNPAKLQSVDAVLEEYDGAEEELFDALEVHYNAFGYFSTH